MLLNTKMSGHAKLRVKCARKTITVRASTSTTNPSIQAKFASFLEKKKDLDRTRWEKIKEVSRTIDHIAKNDIKHTYDFIKEIHPDTQQREDKKETELKSVDLAEEETS
jgi:hypothetical protein